MPATTTSSNFRTILHKMKELGEKTEWLPEAINMVDGNLSIFSDEVFKRLEEMERKINENIEVALQPLMRG